MAETVLINGRAGFIGSHLADEPPRSGFRIRVLDDPCRQVRAAHVRRPRDRVARGPAS